MRDDVRNDKINVGGFSNLFPVIESVDGNAIVSDQSFMVIPLER